MSAAFLFNLMAAFGALLFLPLMAAFGGLLFLDAFAIKKTSHLSSSMLPLQQLVPTPDRLFLGQAHLADLLHQRVADAPVVFGLAGCHTQDQDLRLIWKLCLEVRAVFRVRIVQLTE